MSDRKARERPLGCCKEEVCECNERMGDRLCAELDRLRADNQQLRQSAEVRDAEIARLETDLELARKGAERLRESLGDALALIETITPIEGDTVRKCRAALEHTK